MLSKNDKPTDVYFKFSIHENVIAKKSENRLRLEQKFNITFKDSDSRF